MPHLPVDINYFTDEMIYKAAKELGESDDKKTEGIIQLRKKIKDMSDFVCPTDDNFLLMYLRSRKHNASKAAESIKNFYRNVRGNSELLEYVNYENIKKMYEDRVINPLPYLDQDGCGIILVSLDRFDFDKVNFSVLVAVLVVTEIFIVDRHPAVQICGLKFIVNITGLGVQHVRHISLKYIMLLARGTKGVMPIRYKALHLLNASLVFRWTWNVAKSVMTEKMKQRLFFHSSEDLLQYFDPAIIPQEYGGTLEYDNDIWLKKLREYDERCKAIFGTGLNHKEP